MRRRVKIMASLIFFVTLVSAVILVLMVLPVSSREEMGFVELIRTTNTICTKNSSELWEQVIRCHDPIDEDFLRSSDEANCPRKSSDPNPTDKSVSIRRVFEILCNAVEWNPWRFTKTMYCLGKGHAEEVKTTQDRYGEGVPENIVRCIRKIDLSKY